MGFGEPHPEGMGLTREWRAGHWHIVGQRLRIRPHSD